jgi:uncharacterized protein
MSSMSAISTALDKKPSIFPFIIWLSIFYIAWLGVMIVGEYWSTAIKNWPIAVAMLAGSMVAGSTPIGGGSIGFPILVLVFGKPATLGRNFSLAIQSTGMLSACIYILLMKRKLAWRSMRWAILSTSIATPLSVLFIAPSIQNLSIIIIFTTLLASFGLMTIINFNKISGSEGLPPIKLSFEIIVGIIVGIIGGILTSITGVGIDMTFYTALIILFRADLKIAIPSAVVLMAYTSIVGFITNLVIGNINSDLLGYWIAASPIVVLGAPLGAFIMNLISRRIILMFVSFLCILQFGWTCFNNKIDEITILMLVSGIIVISVLLHFTYNFKWIYKRALLSTISSDNSIH